MNDDWRNWFGWSASKSNTWNDCQKCFLYSYILKNDKDADGLRIKRLSELTTMPFLKGNLIHDAVANQINQALSKRKMSVEMALEGVKRDLAGYEADLSKFAEVENGIGLREDAFDKLLKDANVCLDNFVNGIWPLMADSTFVEVDPGSKTKRGYREFSIGKNKIFLRVDYISKNQGVYTITDWKTGGDSSEEHRLQLAVYAMYVHSRYNVEYENIRTEVVYLRDSKPVNNPVDPEAIKDAQASIETEINEILSKTTVEEFEPNKTRRCRYCKFATECIGKEAILANSIEVFIEGE